MNRRYLDLFCRLTPAVIAVGIVPASAKDIDFNRDIRPLLSNNCFACHGPDKKERKAKLRLDVEDGGAFEERDGITAIVPGKPDESELLARILSTDEEEVMPPPKTGKQLTGEQKELIKRWIAEGASWEGHWVYVPAKRVDPPAPESAPAHPIDRFTFDRLTRENLSPSSEADRRTLIRRLSFDLTGLPPTPEEVDAFVADTGEDAYEKLVERLLGSKRYGERMAIYWLDLVRYADSIGYHSDTTRDVYFYRQWVIDAFNKNQPFDKFTIEQIAGDLLPNATIDQKVASGYNRLLQTTEEGGAQAKEYLAIYAADRVRNVSGVWMGGTLGCAQCHDHKYDPYTAKDFYSMAAFFADVQEKGVGKRDGYIKVPTEEVTGRIESLGRQITEVMKQLDTTTPEIAAAQANWEKGLVIDSRPLLGEWQSVGTFKGGNVNEVFGKKFGPEEKPFDINATFGDRKLKWQKQPGWKDGAVHALSGDQNAATYLTRTIKAERAGPWNVSLGSDDGIVVWLNGKQVLAKNVGRGAAPDQEKVSLDLKKGDNRFLMKIVNAGGGAGFYFKGAGNGLSAEIAAIVKTPAEKRNDEQKASLARHYRGIAPLLADARKRLGDLNKQKQDAEKNLPRTLVSVAVKPRQMRILPRGNWLDDSGEIVKPAIPAFLGNLQTGDKRATRLDLANWIVSKENTMTSRTFVNRLWKLFYGAGLSRNVDDLGSQGQPPSHPKLLDWLATEFISSGWNVKHMVKLMVTSATYRQSSLESKELRKSDPLNTLLLRQARFRIDAEMVRDNALFISGLLVEKVGGASVKPYQPAGYWEHLNFPARKWSPDMNENQYRRGLYTHWQRSFLHPSLLAFDAPTREECTAERPRSNTPLQALVLLNDPSYVESARAFADRIVANGGDGFDSRLDWAFRRAVSRKPNDRERKLIADLFESQKERYGADVPAGKELLTVGTRKPPAEDAGVPELAAWTTVARVILNLHETITRN